MYNLLYSVKSQWHFTGVLCEKQQYVNIKDIWQSSPLFMFGELNV